MKDNYIQKHFGTRLKELRKQRGWTQKELAQKIGVNFPQINKYESGLNAPPFEKLIKLAEALDTTTDFLLIGRTDDLPPLHNARLLERFRELEKFKTDDKETVIKLIDAMVVKQKVEGAVLSPFNNK